MTTGFMASDKKLRLGVATLLLALPGYSLSADISVNALFNGKAVLVIDGGKPRTMASGETTPEGVRLLSANSEAAIVEYKGQRQTLSVGQGTRVATAPSASTSGTTTLVADSRGHFFTTGQINGMSVRFLVDTGATSVALSATDARNLGINYRAGKRGHANTANGVIPIYVIRLDNVRVGEITLNNVEATVSEGPHHVALLGMSFLNRTQMKRDGDTLTLVRRY
ncbi:MAG TPA: retropepsin-like aspartic protease [Pyrinomonadaceae bacterium]|nr:retropepsin-like aspartic protease [Pyrinomonadaceae bacterium]